MSLAQDAGISVVTPRRLEKQHGLSKVAPATVDQVRRALEKAGAEFIDRGVRRGGPSAADIQAIKQDIDRIVARSVVPITKYPPLADDDLYDENGL